MTDTMQRLKGRPADRERVLAALEERECTHCENGELVQSTYKDTVAVVCDGCETPQARFW